MWWRPSLLVFTGSAFVDFADFMDFVAEVEEFLVNSGANMLVQLAHFPSGLLLCRCTDQRPS